MENYFTEVKAAIAVFFTALTALLGWQGVMAVAWVILMLMDYLSGSLAARKTGTWKSSIAREGFLHKGGMILVVLVALEDFLQATSVDLTSMIYLACSEVVASVVAAVVPALFSFTSAPQAANRPITITRDKTSAIIFFIIRTLLLHFRPIGSELMSGL